MCLGIQDRYSNPPSTSPFPFSHMHTVTHLANCAKVYLSTRERNASHSFHTPVLPQVSDQSQF